MRRLLCLFALTLVLSPPLRAQEVADADGFWLTGGVGLATGAHLAAAALVARRTGGDRAVLLRGTMQQEFAIFQSAPEHEWEVGLLFGRVTQRRQGLASAAVGLAAVGGMRRGRFLRTDGPDPEECGGLVALFCALIQTNAYEEENFFTAGVPLDVQVVWTPSRRLGVGLRAYANVNPVRSFAGLTFHVLVGRLR